MENFDEVQVVNYIALMESFLAGQIDARSYQKSIFNLMTRRANFCPKEFEVIQQAFHDADDYDPDVRLEYTIEEPELSKRVRNTLKDLSAIGDVTGTES